MSAPHQRLLSGQEVILLGEDGGYESRGTVVGVHHTSPYRYDVLPRGERSLSKILKDVPVSRLRAVGKPLLAYERGPLPEPKHVLDEA